MSKKLMLVYQFLTYFYARKDENWPMYPIYFYAPLYVNIEALDGFSWCLLPLDVNLL
jgi:hypothetical protein